jgi:hypothetical protein
VCYTFAILDIPVCFSPTRRRHGSSRFQVAAGISRHEGGSMTKLEKRQQDVKKENMDMRQNVERVDQDLEILERHAADVAEVESEILESMKKWDREYKNARLHSVPRPLKHTR